MGFHRLHKNGAGFALRDIPEIDKFHFKSGSANKPSIAAIK